MSPFPVGDPHPGIARWLDDAARLAADDPLFARAAAGPAPIPPLRLRPAGFGTLLYIILEQQVSIRAAEAMYARLVGLIGEPAPEPFLALDDAALRRCGFSRQKAGYGRALAAALRDGALDLAALARLDDDGVVERLTALKGFGRWSAECYLLWALGRPDVLPAADLGLQLGWQWLAGLDARPSAAAIRLAAEPWRPRRTAATLLIWRYYLAEVPQRRAASRAARKGGGPAAAPAAPGR